MNNLTRHAKEFYDALIADKQGTITQDDARDIAQDLRDCVDKHITVPKIQIERLKHENIN